jgi:hypothetical protein
MLHVILSIRRSTQASTCGIKIVHMRSVQANLPDCDDANTGRSSRDAVGQENMTVLDVELRPPPVTPLSVVLHRQVRTAYRGKLTWK